MPSYIMVSPVGMSISLQTPQHYRVFPWLATRCSNIS